MIYTSQRVSGGAEHIAVSPYATHLTYLGY